MTVGVVHLGPVTVETSARMRALIASSKRVMPDCPIAQLTDRTTPAIRDVDEIVRFDVGPAIALAVLDLYALAGDGDWLFVDTDVLMVSDVQHVFDQPFDLAVASRAGTFRDGEADLKFMRANPYNKGVVFSRSPQFWQDAAAVLRTMKPARQAWMGDQIAMNAVIASGRYHVLELDASYNYAPHRRDESWSGQRVVHFKGARKPWMVERAS